MEQDVLLKSLDQGLLILTLNRPERRNALDEQLAESLYQAVERAARDDDVRALLIQGSGTHFCVGGDVKSMAQADPADDYHRRVAQLRRRMDVARLLHEMPKPSVAKIQGAAAGAGLALALACDLRVTTYSAKLTTAFAKVGLSGDYGGSYFMTRLIGSAKARELYLTGAVLQGEEARQLGLVTEVVADAEVDEAALKLAHSLARGPTLTLGAIKQNLNLAERTGIEAVFDLEAMNHIRCSLTEDHREAAKAFVEKRLPEFRGR